MWYFLQNICTKNLKIQYEQEKSLTLIQQMQLFFTQEKSYEILK